MIELKNYELTVLIKNEIKMLAKELSSEIFSILYIEGRAKNILRYCEEWKNLPTEEI